MDLHLGRGEYAGSGTPGFASTHSPEEREVGCEAAGLFDLRSGRCGARIRREFPELLYRVAVDADERGVCDATWTGISGDRYYRNGEGADFTTVTNEWLDTNIRSKGPLGKKYPKFMFIMEGDTPSFLGLIDNGLNAYRRPDWGGWGGRYVYRQPYGETHAIWTQGGDEFARVDSRDTVTWPRWKRACERPGDDLALAGGVPE